MPKYASKDIAELAHQLELSPKRKRLEQMKGIESLLGMLQPDKGYPFDWVCFHITGYRPRKVSNRPVLDGHRLVADLVTLAEQITRKTAVPIAEIKEGYRTCEEVAAELQVSTKTIRRWRRRGLLGFRAQFEDGIARLVYLNATVERFVRQNKALVERGASFRQLSPEEKQQIVALAEGLLRKKRMKLHVVAREIAARTGRAVETIRYTLRRFDLAAPERALFAGNGLPAAPALHQRVWRARQAGEDDASIAARFELSAEELAEIVREMTLRQLKAEPPSYVYHPLFDAPTADALILECPRPPTPEAAPKPRPPKDLPAYLRSLYETPLMTPEQEVDIFRRYNYLKYKIAKRIEALDITTSTTADLSEIQALTAEVEKLRQEIVRANLRLVVSIAKKHVGWSPRFFEVVSDGNMSLLRAVEKFDFSRGYKFSTYASWAIMKNYARTVPEEHYHVSRYVTGQDELLAAAPDPREAPASKLDGESLSDALKAGLELLNERERDVVSAHFGLFGAEGGVTLEELGKRLGVTKERVRQIERRALDKMRQALSPALAELLPD